MKYLNFRICFIAITVLYSTTSLGQVFEMVKDINLNGSSYPRFFIENDNLLYVVADDGVHWYEYWVTDGTSEGTTLTKDIGPAWPLNPLSYNNKLYFNDYTEEHGDAMWETDGTEDGTQLFKDFYPNGIEAGIGSLVEFDGKLYFGAADGGGGTDLWVTDGTEDGTEKVYDFTGYSSGISITPNPIEANRVVFGNKFYFFASECLDTDYCPGVALWSSDGTQSGTQMVKDINTIVPTQNTYLSNLTLGNNKLYFTGNDGIHGKELWVTDGTEGGTQMVKDINTTPEGGSSPHSLFAYNDKLYFAANDGEMGIELWVTDGTEVGTYMVKDIMPDENSSHISSMALYNGKIYFSAVSQIFGFTLRYDLFESDGTEAGTQKITDEQFWHSLQQLTVYNNKLYFYGDYNQKELWVSDGDASGTYELAPPGSNSGGLGDSYQLMVFQDALYLTANWSSHGSELWKITDSDPSSTNNELISDILVFPNPTTHELFLKGNMINRENLVIELFDILGKPIIHFVSKSTSVYNSEISIDLSNVPNGQYIVSIKSEDEVIHRSNIIKID